MRVARGTALPGYWENLAERAKEWSRTADVCPFWLAAESSIPEWRQEFRNATGGALLADDAPLPKFCAKGAARIQSKAYSLRRAKPRQPSRVHGLWDPKGGAPIPYHNDLVRTRVACAFLDGVEFLSDRLEALARKMEVLTERRRRALPTGYFAQHIYFQHDCFYRFGSAVTVPVRIEVEVQIATALAKPIWEQGHGVYEQEREDAPTGPRDDHSWAWRPKEPKFLARQLGHTIHLADGLLVQLRDYNRAAPEGSRKGPKDA